MTLDELQEVVIKLQERVRTLEISLEKRETSRVSYTGVKSEHQKWVEQREKEMQKRNEGR